MKQDCELIISSMSLVRFDGMFVDYNFFSYSALFHVYVFPRPVQVSTHPA